VVKVRKKKGNQGNQETPLMYGTQRKTTRSDSDQGLDKQALLRLIIGINDLGTKQANDTMPDIL